jgi:hypothetical protein
VVVLTVYVYFFPKTFLKKRLQIHGEQLRERKSFPSPVPPFSCCYLEKHKNNKKKKKTKNKTKKKRKKKKRENEILAKVEEKKLRSKLKRSRRF